MNATSPLVGPAALLEESRRAQQTSVRRSLTTYGALGLWVFLGFAPCGLVAQEVRLGGTVEWNYVRYNALPGTNLRGGYLAPAGRLFLQITNRWSVGVALSSWARNAQSPGLDGVLTHREEAGLRQIYAQLSPISSRTAFFVRTGLGIANMESLVPNGGLIDSKTTTKVLVTLGAGYDVRLARHVFLTPAIDGGRILGIEQPIHEISGGLSFGLGVTIR